MVSGTSGLSGPRAVSRVLTGSRPGVGSVRSRSTTEGVVTEWGHNRGIAGTDTVQVSSDSIVLIKMNV